MRVCKEDGCTESLEGRDGLCKTCLAPECIKNRAARLNRANREKAKTHRELRKRKGVIA